MTQPAVTDPLAPERLVYPGEYPYRGQIYDGARVHALREDRRTAPHFIRTDYPFQLVNGPVTCEQCRKQAGPFPDDPPPLASVPSPGVSITTLEQDLEQALADVEQQRLKDTEAKRRMGGLIGQQKNEIRRLQSRLSSQDELRTQLETARRERDAAVAERNSMELLVAVVLFKHGTELDENTRYVDVSNLEYRAARELLKSYTKTRVTGSTLRLAVGFRP